MILLALALLSALIVAGMCRVGTLDHPVARSSHGVPTPKGGGVGIAVAFAAGIAIMPAPGNAAVTFAALFLAAASYLDDVRHSPFWLKLLAQTAAATAIIAAGMPPGAFAAAGFGVLPLGFAAPALGLAWLLFATNAVNFMDGLNGLAAGSIAAACLVLVLANGLAASWPEALLVAGIAGFLPFNYPRARIFMGDVGSQFIGVVVAAQALRHAGDTRLSWVLPLGLGPMLLDVTYTLLQRARRGERLTEAHRGHLYQLAHRSGVPAWLIAAIYVCMAGWGAVCGAEAGISANPTWVVASLVPFLGWALWVQIFRSAEDAPERTE